MTRSKGRTAKPTQKLAASTSSRQERRSAGKALRERTPHEAHAAWSPGASRRDPVEQVLQANDGRIADLVPIRHGRMMVSPFTFFRGAANIMAADLAGSASSGIQTQICGDCHLLNMGGFATAERRMVFDINDFDETLPGPWEWDVKRLSASIVLASRSNGFGRTDQKDAALSCVRSYREHMADFSVMHPLDVWYARVDLSAAIKTIHDSNAVARARKRLGKARARAVTEHQFPELVVQRDGRSTIKDAPPLIVRHAFLDRDNGRQIVEQFFGDCRVSMADDRRVLLDRFRLQDVALKVVGVGSVGTLCAVILLQAEDADPLLLQFKEARRSVLDGHLPKSLYRNQGQRVVEGQRLMQAASDILLGWSMGREEKRRHFYVRQLRDMKLKPLVEAYNASTMLDYASVCGWALARAHARAGDAAMISGYLGKHETFDAAIARFSVSYADQSERDHAAFLAAIRDGRVRADPDE